MSTQGKTPMAAARGKRAPKHPHIGEFRHVWCVGAVWDTKPGDPLPDPRTDVSLKECIFLGETHGRQDVWKQRDYGWTGIYGVHVFDTEVEALRAVINAARQEIKDIEERCASTLKRLDEIAAVGSEGTAP